MDKSELKISVVIGRGHGQALYKIVDQDLERGLVELQRVLEQKYGLDAVALILKRTRILINFRGRDVLVERYRGRPIRRH